MKTEQEQIEKMARTMCGYCSTDGKCAVSKNGREPDICANVDTQHCLYKEYAERLIDSNYGDVSEYKAEREMLGSKIKVLEQRLNNKYIEIDNLNRDYSNAFERSRTQRREIERLKDGYAQVQEQFAQYQMASDKEIKAQRKQAQIDVLNRLKVFSEPYPNSWGIYVIDVDHIDKLIKEVQNETINNNLG